MLENKLIEILDNPSILKILSDENLIVLSIGIGKTEQGNLLILEIAT